MWETLQSIVPDYKLLNTDSRSIDREGPYFVSSEEQVAALAADNVPPEQVYVAVSGLSDENIARAIGKCRFVADSLDNLRRLDGIAAKKEQGEQLVSVGLRLIPTAYDNGIQYGVREAELTALSEEIRTLSAVSVRGCFIQGQIDGLHGKDLGRYFRNCYELSKRMTVILPCAMPYLCIIGGADAVQYNLHEHPESLPEFQRAAQIVAMQNNTAFYAKLLLL